MYRIYELFCKKNGGASSARNEGIRRAEGKYVSFIDGDDFVDADYLMNRVEAIRNNNAICVWAGFVYMKMENLDRKQS